MGFQPKSVGLSASTNNEEHKVGTLPRAIPSKPLQSIEERYFKEMTTE